MQDLKDSKNPKTSFNNEVRKGFTTYQNAESIRQLKMLAAEEQMTLQALMAEAINLVFEKRGKPPIATP